MAVRRFEELRAWQKARRLTALVYRRSATGPLARDWALRDQMRRAAVSVMANLAEGFERGGHADMIRLITIAKASCAEVRSHVYVALDAGYLSETEFQEMMRTVVDVARTIGMLRARLVARRQGLD